MAENVQGSGDTSVSNYLPIQTPGVDEGQAAAGAQVVVPQQQDTIASADEGAKGATIQADSPKPTQPEVIDGAAANITPAMIAKLTPAQLESFLNQTNSISGDGNKSVILGVGAALLSIMNEYYEIARSVLDAWVKNVQEESQRVKDYINSAEHQKKLKEQSSTTAAANQRNDEVENKAKAGGNFQGEFVGATQLQQDHLVSPTTHVDALSAFSTGLQWLSNDLAYGASASSETSLKERSTIAVSTLIVASAVTGGLYAGASVEASLVAYVPVRDAVNASMQANPNQQVDNSAALALLAALFGGGMLQSAAVDSHMKAQAESKPPTRVDFAQAFVGKVFQNIYSEEFAQSVLSLTIADPTQRAEVAKDPQLKAQALATVRFAMLSIALDVTFSALNKPLDGESFQAVIQEDPSKLTKDTYGSLFSEVQNLVRGLNLQLGYLSVEDQGRLKQSMAAHFDARTDDSEYFVPMEQLDTVIRSLPRSVAPMLA